MQEKYAKIKLVVRIRPLLRGEKDKDTLQKKQPKMIRVVDKEVNLSRGH